MAIPIGSCPICIATRINCGETPNISAASAGFMLFSLNLSRLSMYFPPSAFLPGLGLATVVGCITRAATAALGYLLRLPNISATLKYRL